MNSAATKLRDGGWTESPTSLLPNLVTIKRGSFAITVLTVAIGSGHRTALKLEFATDYVLISVAHLKLMPTSRLG